MNCSRRNWKNSVPSTVRQWPSVRQPNSLFSKMSRLRERRVVTGLSPLSNAAAWCHRHAVASGRSSSMRVSFSQASRARGAEVVHEQAHCPCTHVRRHLFCANSPISGMPAPRRSL